VTREHPCHPLSWVPKRFRQPNSRWSRRLGLSFSIWQPHEVLNAMAARIRHSIEKRATKRYAHKHIPILRLVRNRSKLNVPYEVIMLRVLSQHQGCSSLKVQSDEVTTGSSS
jgi:hypothetical protein